MFGIDLCSVKMKLEYNLKFSLRHPYYIQLQQRLPNKITKNLKKRRGLSSPAKQGQPKAKKF